MARVSDLYRERVRSIKTVLFFIVSVSLLSREAVPTHHLFTLVSPISKILCLNYKTWDFICKSRGVPGHSLAFNKPATRMLLIYAYQFTPVQDPGVMGRKVTFVGMPIDLVTVFDAILTSGQTCEKLQCLYENPMSNNFPKTSVLKKIWIVN